VFSELLIRAARSSATLVAIEGLCIIAISVVGRSPGYGILSMYIVFCLNLSVMNFAIRLIVLSSLAICYLAAILIFNQVLLRVWCRPSLAMILVLVLPSTQRRCWGGITGATMLSHAAYFIIFMLGMSFSVFAREVSQRRQSERQHRATLQKQLLEQEERRSMALLANMLPLSIVKQLTEGRELIADQFDMVTVLFTDLKGFTEFASRLDPKDLVTFLNIMYTQFDLITDKYGLYKVEIIGDAYFVVGGCPEPCEDSAERCTAAALELIGVMPVLREIAGVDIRMRVGIHCGPTIAGVVGTKDPRYHLFGETGTYAMLMENTGIPDQVHMSDACRNRIFARQLERRNKVRPVCWMGTFVVTRCTCYPCRSVLAKESCETRAIQGSADVVRSECGWYVGAISCGHRVVAFPCRAQGRRRCQGHRV
jgi:class 3 adenylate cyclase